MDVKLDFNQVLEQLAKAFNTTVDKLYPVLVQQAYVTGIASLLGILIAWSLLATIIIIFKKHGIRKEKHYDGVTDGTVVLIIITSIVSVATIIITATVGYEALTALLNPEYWALKEVLSYIQ